MDRHGNNFPSRLLSHVARLAELIGSTWSILAFSIMAAGALICHATTGQIARSTMQMMRMASAVALTAYYSRH